MVDCKRIGRGRRKGWVKGGYYIHIEDMSWKEKTFGKAEAVAELHRSQPYTSGLACSFAWTKMELDKGYSSSGWNF